MRPKFLIPVPTDKESGALVLVLQYDGHELLTGRLRGRPMIETAGGHKSPEMITSLAKQFSVQLFSCVDEAGNSGELVRLLLGRTTPLHPSPALILPSPWVDAIRMHIAPTTVGPVDIIVDASTVVVQFEGGLLHIAPAAGVICMEVYIEQLSDGSILISDNVGHPRSDNAPEFHGCVIGIDIVLGPTGDDKVHLDLVPNGALARNVTFTTCVGHLIEARSRRS